MNNKNKQKQQQANVAYIDHEEYKKGYIKRAIFGIFMGISNGVPGYSGGTTLTLLGFHDAFIFRTKALFSHFDQHWWKNLVWLLPFFITWMLAVLGFSQVTNLIAEANFQFLLVLAFSLFTLLAIPSFVMVNKPHLIKFDENKKIRLAKVNIRSIVLFIMGLTIILMTGIIVFFVGDANLEPSNVEISKTPDATWAAIIFSGMFAGFLMPIPGLSGSLVLFSVGTYDDFYFGLLIDPIGNFWLLILFAIAMIIGVVSNIWLSAFFLKKFRNYYLSFIFGIIYGLFVTILLAGKFYFEQIKDLDATGIIITVFSLIAIVGLNVGLFFYTKGNKKSINKNFE